MSIMEGTMRRRSLYGFEMREPDERRVDHEKRKGYDIKQLWQHSHEILRLAVLGYKPKVIAEVLGLSTQTVSNTLNSSLGELKLSELRRERDEETLDAIKEVQERLLPKALKTYEELFDDKQVSPTLRKETADTIVMDILGHRAPKEIHGKFAHAHLTGQEIEEIKERGRKAARELGQLAEAEVVEDGLAED